MLIYHCFVTHHTTTQQKNIDIKCAFQSYSIKKNILIQFLIQKKLIVVGIFLLLAGILLNQASFGPRILKKHQNSCKIRTKPKMAKDMWNVEPLSFWYTMCTTCTNTV